MIPNTNEQVIQQNTIKLLESMGFTYISRDDNVILRSNRLHDVLLKGILAEQLQKINSFEYKGISYRFSSKNITRAIEDLNIPLNEGLNATNKKITDKLLLGGTYDEEVGNGVYQGFSLRYIDFTNPSNNVFHVTEEYAVVRRTTTELEKHRRPDIVLFINGIPLAICELKKSSINVEQGISQMIRNQFDGEIPDLFKYIQITLASNNFECKYATIDTPEKFYNTWEEDNLDDLANHVTNRSISKLDQTVFSLFNPTRLLELIYSFILFDNRIKKIARYPQYFAIKTILNKIQRFSPDGSRAGGLIWHTPGSGKSLTMVMLSKLIKQTISNSRIIVVTDRTDLDGQIHETFGKTDIIASRVTSGDDLIEQLKAGVSVITTLVHKFDTPHEKLFKDTNPNIFVLVDESHRTHGGDLHKSMKQVFPNACYLGFTGTPLLKREKSSIAKFGGLIHRYTIDQAIKDKAVLPLLYEGRFVDQWINDQAGLDRKFELIARNLTAEQKIDLQRKWARFSTIASSEHRLAIIALDINQHYKETFQGTGLKAMLATNSKYEALKYHEIFESYGDIKSACIISSPDSREGYDEVNEQNKKYVANAWSKILKNYDSEKSFFEKVINKFKSDSDEVELLIVVDKLLTGFDVPRATVFYIDKQLQDHSLLQAISRVNRLHDGKDYGLIIDYRGLLGNLDQTLSSYKALAGFDTEDLSETVIDIRLEIKKVKKFYTELQELFHDVTNKNDQESYQVYLGDETKRKKFYKLLSEFARALKLTLSSEKVYEVLTRNELAQYKLQMKFYSNLRRAIQIRYHEVVDFGKYEPEMQKLLDTFISADDVNSITPIVSIFDHNFDQEINKMQNDNAKADSILSATSKFIHIHHDQNPKFYDKLSQMIEQIIKDYRDGRLSNQDKLQQAETVRTILNNQQIDTNSQYPKELGTRACARALYDNLQELMNKVPNSEFIKIVLEIDQIFSNASKKPDWQHNSDVKNQIDQAIDDIILYSVEQRFGIKINETQKIIDIARSIGINNYVKSSSNTL
jgi:type I restriction enzyme R subunit